MSDLLSLVSGHPETFRVGAAFVLLAALVALTIRKERRNSLFLLALYAASIVLRVASRVFDGAGMPTSSRVAQFLGLLLEGLALLNLAVVLFFGVLLRGVRVEAPRILRDLTLALGTVALVLYLFGTYRVDVTGIVATSAVITAVIGFSLQDTLANVMGGVALQLDRSFAPGDWIRVGDVTGKVQEIRWRYTAVDTRNGDVVLFPNSVLAKTQILLVGKAGDGPPKQRRWVWFNVDYRTTPAAVISAVDEALRRAPIPNVAAEPEPNTVLMDFKESWAQYAVRYWLTDLLPDDKTDSLVRERVFFALRRAGIPPSIPAQSVFLTPEDDRRIVHLREKERHARLLAVESVAIFRSLTGEERAQLAENLVPAPYSPGEPIVIQGKQVHHLYILTKGIAEVFVSVEGAPPRLVATLEAPNFFGEMGMLTGEPRRATVIAKTEAECWRVEKEIFQRILEARPPIADDISHILASRDVELAAAREGLSEEAKRLRLAHEHGSLLAKIQRFFGIG